MPNTFDARVKSLLARKDVLANVLIHLIDEFKGYSFEQALSYINEDDIEIGTHSIDDSSKGILKYSLDTNDTSTTEGVRNFDIKFKVTTPIETEIYINLEAQKNSNPGYSLVKRGIYYLSRMISSQYNVEFTHSNFDGLKKVYSIWLCTNVKNSKQSNSIIRYSIKPEVITGNTYAIASESEYDLETLTMLFLNPRISSDDSIINMFKLLLYDICEGDKANDALRILDNEYKIRDLQEEVNIMCNMSGYWEELGLERGMEKGMKQGIEKGIEQGIEKGIEQERKNNINNMYNSGLSVNQIASILKLNTNVVEKYLDIPNTASDETDLFND